jgi:hypothetical protein
MLLQWERTEMFRRNICLKVVLRFLLKKGEFRPVKGVLLVNLLDEKHASV